MRRTLAAVCRFLLFAFLSVLLGGQDGQAVERTSSYMAAMASIRADQAQGCVDVLADDSLEGREAGSRGGRAAGDWLAARMREIGLAPAGGHGEYFQPFGAGYRNVLAKLEGSDETLRDQVVVVGAHYDHVGYGNRQNSFGPIGQIHNGADDNASGSAGLVELAEACCLLAEPPRRTILFAGWDAEEKGLLGSKHWIAHPTLPSSQVVAMIDMDMIGRLRDNHLIVFGSRTGYGWRRLLSTQNEDLDLAIDFSWAMRPDADHYPFFDRQIPVLMVNTNLHDQYHRPGDDANLINSRGIERVARLLFGALYELANRDQTPAYRDAARRETEKSKQLLASRQPARQDRLGAGWDDRDSSAEGVRLTRIVWGSPAHRAALRAGDRIVEFAGRPIHAADDLSAVVMSATSPAEAVVNRPGSAEPLAVSVPLDGAPMRLGIRWRLDDAEPGTIALTEVLPGSPAELAGLAAGDHVYQIAGRDFADEAEFAEQARSLPGPIELTVERDGQLRTVEIRFDADSLRRAA